MKTLSKTRITPKALIKASLTVLSSSILLIPLGVTNPVTAQFPIPNPINSGVNALQEMPRKLAEAALNLGLQNGYSMADPIIKQLPRSQYDDFQLSDLGWSMTSAPMVVTAVCDGNCSDIDMEVRDSEDRVILRDRLVNDYPKLELNMQEADDYTLRVIMYSCNAPTCFYGLGVFTQN